MDKIILAVHIKACGECPHLDHSGAFTEGGVKAICGNYYALDLKRQDGWKFRVVNVESIPEWCPLENQGV